MRRAMPRLSCVAGRSSLASPFISLTACFKHGGVELKADSLNVAALLAAEHVAGAAQFQIESGDFEAGAEVGEFLECGEAAARNFGEFAVRGGMSR